MDGSSLLEGVLSEEPPRDGRDRHAEAFQDGSEHYSTVSQSDRWKEVSQRQEVVTLPS